jgi:hypothetical protein
MITLAALRICSFLFCFCFVIIIFLEFIGSKCNLGMIFGGRVGNGLGLKSKDFYEPHGVVSYGRLLGSLRGWLLLGRVGSYMYQH